MGTDNNPGRVEEKRRHGGVGDAGRGKPSERAPKSYLEAGTLELELPVSRLQRVEAEAAENVDRLRRV